MLTITRLCFMEEQKAKTGKYLQPVILALFAALIAVGSFVAIPIGSVPIVLQNMLAVLAGCVLGGAQGAASVGLFLVAGCIGLPVFSGGRGGIAALTGPTGGFLSGYFFAALIAGSIIGKPSADEQPFEKKHLLRITLAGVSGLIVVYIPGVYQFMSVTHKSLSAAIAACMLPFLPGDLLKLIILIPVAAKIRPLTARYLPNPNNR